MNIFDSVINLWNSLFGTSSNKSIANDRQMRTTPVTVDLTFDETVNVELTRALWHNSQPGFKLGAPLCYNPIAVPLAFMGVPHTDFEDWDRIDDEEFWKEKIDFYNDKYIIEKKTIQLMCHRDGTIIIWPWFDSKVNHVRWTFIKPEQVSLVVMDPDTKELIILQTAIRYNFYGENEKLYNFLEKRTYSKSVIKIERTGDVPPNLNNQDVRRNPIGILPIIFANNREPGEFEGHSDYERIIPLIKAYSTVNQRAHEKEANMNAKLVQAASDADKWKDTNKHLFNGNDLVNISAIDFVLNIEEEKTEFVVPTGLNANAMELLENNFHLIVQSGSFPEILYGLKTRGNHASVKEQMALLFSFVGDKQNQADTPYLQLNQATLKLEAMANMRQVPEGIKNMWNDLTVMTEVERAQIFKDYAFGIEKLLGNYAIDLQSTHKLLYELTNGMITSDYDDFVKQIKEYGTIKSLLEQEYGSIRETTEQQVNKALQNINEPSDVLIRELQKIGINLLQKEKGNNGNGKRIRA